MKSFTTWILALIAVAGIAGFSGAWSSVQGGAGKQANPGKVQGKKANAKGRAEKQAALKKVLPTLKTSLGEAIALAEKESTGKAYSADIELGKEGKPAFKVGLLVSDKFTYASVDPETKKVTVVQPMKEGEHPEGGKPEGGDGDDGEEDGG